MGIFFAPFTAFKKLAIKTVVNDICIGDPVPLPHAQGAVHRMGGDAVGFDC